MQKVRVLLLVAVGLTVVSRPLVWSDPVPNDPSAASAMAGQVREGQGPGTLLLWSDGLCRLVVDGQVVGTLAAGEWLRVPVGLGDHVVQAIAASRSPTPAAALAERSGHRLGTGRMT